MKVLCSGFPCEPTVAILHRLHLDHFGDVDVDVDDIDNGDDDDNDSASHMNQR